MFSNKKKSRTLKIVHRVGGPFSSKKIYELRGWGWPENLYGMTYAILMGYYYRRMGIGLSMMLQVNLKPKLNLCSNAKRGFGDLPSQIN